MTDSLNTFDVTGAGVQVDSGPFVVSVEYLTTTFPFTFATTITHDGNGCTPGKNLVYTPRADGRTRPASVPPATG